MSPLTTDPADLVDLDRYPIADPASAAYAAVATWCRTQLAETGCAILAGFLTPEAAATMRADARELAPLSHHSVVAEATAYLELADESFPAGHPRRLTGPTSLGAVPYDRFPAGSPLRRLYEWDGLMTFLADALGKEQLYRYDDPLGALNLAVMSDRDELWWHFDQTDFVTSLALENAASGGDFEYAPLVRSTIDECYDDVAAVLRDESESIVRVPMDPGTLMLFEGRHSVHRVTPIRGDGMRLVALLAYDTRPGTCSSEMLRAVRYGRTE